MTRVNRFIGTSYLVLRVQLRMYRVRCPSKDNEHGTSPAAPTHRSQLEGDVDTISDVRQNIWPGVIR